MDIVLAFVPWKVIWSLTMNKKEKFGVLVAMSMGVLYVHPSPLPPTLRFTLPCNRANAIARLAPAPV